MPDFWVALTITLALATAFAITARSYDRRGGDARMLAAGFVGLLTFAMFVVTITQALPYLI